MMVRKLVAVAAVSGSLALGAVGIGGTAGAAGTTTPSPTSQLGPSSARLATRCAKAEKVATRIEALEAKAQAWLPKAEAREAKAKAAGHTKLAQRIAARITRVQKREALGNALLARIAAKCGTSGSTSTS
jgi:hypothetical protein